MKKYITILFLFLSITTFGQIDELNRALELFNNKKYEQSEQLFTEALKGKYGKLLSATEFETLKMLALIKYTQNDYEKAVPAYQRLYDFIEDKNFEGKDNYVKEIKNLIDELKRKLPNSKLSENIEKDPNSNNDKIVTLTVSGTGKTIEDAKNNALRSAIEQAFGVFISSKTEILNDNLVKDEIVSVSNGSIQKFNIVSEVEIPNAGFATTLNATVSVSKLISFVESKGVVAEFKGSLFSFNIKQQILNENNEVKAINDLCETIKQIFDKSVDYQITPENPVALDNTNQNWAIKLNIGISINENILNIADYLFKNLKNISMTNIDVDNYRNLNKLTYPISFASDKKSITYINLRKKESLDLLINTINYFDKSVTNFEVNNGNSTIIMNDKFSNFKAISNALILINKKYSDEIPEGSTVYRNESASKIDNIKTNNLLFTNQFEFIKNLLTYYDYETKDERLWGDDKWKNFEIKKYNPGTIISFLLFRKPSGSVYLEYIDKRTLEEINKITEYKISKK